MKTEPHPPQNNKRRLVKRRYLLGGLLAGGFVVINAPWAFGWLYQLYYRPVERLPGVSLGPQTRLLVLAPHPDDEALACGGLIREVLAGGGQAGVVWLTSGDGFEWDVRLVERTLRPTGAASVALGRRRMGEARRAAEILGVPPEHRFFLGYPDQGLGQLLTDAHRTEPYRSSLTLTDRVPYAGTVSEGAPYTGESLERDLRTVLDRFRPTLVLAPALRDTHPDHRATAELALRVLGDRAEADLLRYWVIHGGLEWPLPKGYHPTLPLEPPTTGQGLPWHRLPLTPEVLERKHQAILAHQSQMELLSRFMLAFVRTNELFSERPT